MPPEITARIALDAMGGDQAPRETVRGALEAIARDQELAVLLVGQTDRIAAEIDAAGPASSERVEIVPASQVVGAGDSAAMALRQKDTSIRRGVELLREGQVDALVAAGNTGATVAASTVLLRLLAGVRRPGIAVTLPTAMGECVLCDAGANIHCKPLHLYHYGIMAAQYSRAVFGHEHPTVGLLNVGSEEGKGTELVRETSALFAGCNLNYVGNVEGNDVFSGRCDVIVCEGFAGNVVLKTAEGLYEVMARRLADLTRTLDGIDDGETAERVGEALQRFRRNMDYGEKGGAPLLGLNGLVVISHGRSDARAIRNALIQAAEGHRRNVLGAMLSDLQAQGSAR